MSVFKFELYEQKVLDEYEFEEVDAFYDERISEKYAYGAILKLEEIMDDTFLSIEAIKKLGYTDELDSLLNNKNQLTHSLGKHPKDVTTDELVFHLETIFGGVLEGLKRAVIEFFKAIFGVIRAKTVFIFRLLERYRRMSVKLEKVHTIDEAMFDNKKGISVNISTITSIYDRLIRRYRQLSCLTSHGGGGGNYRNTADVNEFIEDLLVLTSSEKDLIEFIYDTNGVNLTEEYSLLSRLKKYDDPEIVEFFKKKSKMFNKITPVEYWHMTNPDGKTYKDYNLSAKKVYELLNSITGCTNANRDWTFDDLTRSTSPVFVGRFVKSVWKNHNTIKTEEDKKRFKDEVSAHIYAFKCALLAQSYTLNTIKKIDKVIIRLFKDYLSCAHKKS